MTFTLVYHYIIEKGIITWTTGDMLPAMFSSRTSHHNLFVSCHALFAIGRRALASSVCHYEGCNRKVLHLILILGILSALPNAGTKNTTQQYDFRYIRTVVVIIYNNNLIFCRIVIFKTQSCNILPLVASLLGNQLFLQQEASILHPQLQHCIIQNYCLWQSCFGFVSEILNIFLPTLT